MGAFASVLQSVGGVGNDVAMARQNVKDLSQQDTVNSFTNQLNALKLRQLQLQLAAPPKDDVAGQIAAMEKVLGRPLTDAEKATWLQIAPKAAAATAPQRPLSVDGAVFDPNTKTFMYPDQSKLPQKAAAGDKTAFEAWRTQNPSAPIADWLKLQEKFKKPAGSAEDIGGAGLAALARAHAQGEDLPITKQGAALASQMEAMGLKAPNKKEVPADIKALVAQPPPATPTVQDSQRLAAAADRVFGGTAFRQDLMARGRQSALMGLRSPYAPQGYSSAEYNDLLGRIKDSVASGGDSGAGGSADDEINKIMDAVGKVKR